MIWLFFIYFLLFYIFVDINRINSCSAYFHAFWCKEKLILAHILDYDRTIQRCTDLLLVLFTFIVIAFFQSRFYLSSPSKDCISQQSWCTCQIVNLYQRHFSHICIVTWNQPGRCLEMMKLKDMYLNFSVSPPTEQEELQLQERVMASINCYTFVVCAAENDSGGNSESLMDVVGRAQIISFIDDCQVVNSNQVLWIFNYCF